MDSKEVVAAYKTQTKTADPAENDSYARQKSRELAGGMNVLPPRIDVGDTFFVYKNKLSATVTSLQLDTETGRPDIKWQMDIVEGHHGGPDRWEVGQADSFNGFKASLERQVKSWIQSETEETEDD